jgi:hypothetical protein
MPKRIQISQRHEDLMRRLFASVEYSVPGQARRKKGTIKPIITALQADGLDLCEDTIRRYAVKLGLIEPVGAKYIPRTKIDKWTRPCMRCGNDEPRPKGLYLCDSCRERAKSYG